MTATPEFTSNISPEDDTGAPNERRELIEAEPLVSRAAISLLDWVLSMTRRRLSRLQRLAQCLDKCPLQLQRKHLNGSRQQEATLWSRTRHIKHHPRRCAMAAVLFLVTSTTSRGLNDRGSVRLAGKTTDTDLDADLL